MRLLAAPTSVVSNVATKRSAVWHSVRHACAPTGRCLPGRRRAWTADKSPTRRVAGSSGRAASAERPPKVRRRTSCCEAVAPPLRCSSSLWALKIWKGTHSRELSEADAQE
eukprot:13795563-Alexandrium_andersonii.AAC.2